MKGIKMHKKMQQLANEGWAQDMLDVLTVGLMTLIGTTFIGGCVALWHYLPMFLIRFMPAPVAEIAGFMAVLMAIGVVLVLLTAWAGESN